MKKADFDGLVAGLEDALAYAEGQPNPGTRAISVEVDRTFVAAARLKAGLTQHEFARCRRLTRDGPQVGARRTQPLGRRANAGAHPRARPGAGDRGGGAGGGDEEAEGWGGGVTEEIALSARAP
jgi:hypothetical protein